MIFVKAAISRTVHLRECLLPLYFYYSSEFMCPSPLFLCHSFVCLHPSLCVYCFHYLFGLCFYLCVCHSHCSPFRYLVTIIFIQQLVPINLCFLFTTPDPLPPYYSSFLALLFQLIYSCDQYIVLPSFLFLFYHVFLLNFALIVIFYAPLVICPCYLPFLFYFYSILLDSLSPVPTFCPFLVSFIIIPLSNPASTMSTLHCLYHFYPS